MELIYPFVEMAATFVECVIVLSAITDISGKRWKGKQHFIPLFAFSVCSSLLIIWMNSIAAFSFMTPIISMSFIIFVSSRIMTNGNLLIRCIGCIITHFVIQTIDYVLFVLMGILFNVPHDTFNILMAPGLLRAIFLGIDKSCDIIVYFILRKQLHKMTLLAKKPQMILFPVSLITYIMMQYLFSTFLSSDLATMQTAVVISWLFILFFIGAIVAFFVLMTKAEKEKQTHALLASVNEMMTENYRLLNENKQAYAARLHDFNHHLRVLRELISTGKEEEANNYISSLLTTSNRDKLFCQSGNDIIDAVVNYYAGEAKRAEITLEVTANFHVLTDLPATDICAVLSNQLSNAFTACGEIDRPQDRKVFVSIYQQGCMAFFRVENTVAADPFAGNPNLRTTKPASSSPHGLGLTNIRDIVQKHDGDLQHKYENGRFISRAFLCFEPFDTQPPTV